MSGLTALVVGATGAIGHALTEQLVANPGFKKVITVGRRPVQLSSPPPEGALEQRTVDMDKMETAQDAFRQADVVFCTLGTTRAVAGSAEQFWRVDCDYVARAAELAKQGKVKHFSVVSAQGANADAWASNARIFHPLLYTKAKGMAEQAALKQGFVHTSIFRPGLLDRGNKTRSAEAFMHKVIAPLLGAIKVEDVAKQMIQDALAAAAERSASSGEGNRPVWSRIYQMKQMMEAAKTGQPPVSDLETKYPPAP